MDIACGIPGNQHFFVSVQSKSICSNLFLWRFLFTFQVLQLSAAISDGVYSPLCRIIAFLREHADKTPNQCIRMNKQVRYCCSIALFESFHDESSFGQTASVTFSMLALPWIKCTCNWAHMVVSRNESRVPLMNSQTLHLFMNIHTR